MAKTKGKFNGSAKGASVKAEGVAPYFRPIFLANPKLLRTRSNQALLDQWEKDHPEFSGVPNNVKTGLANLKSVMRKKLRIKRGKKAAKAEAATGTAVAKPKPLPMLSSNAADTALEHLEMQIDECLTLARTLDREGLAHVIKVLRSARNEVVWMSGGEE
jgi:hypothetical protein